jgi:hypothetical protein
LFLTIFLATEIPTILAFPNLTKYWAARIAVYSLTAASVPLSNLLLASEGSFKLRDVLLIEPLSKTADSIIKFLDLSVISLYKPPMAPATESTFLLSAITRSC